MLSKDLLLEMEKFISSRTEPMLDQRITYAAAICLESMEQNELEGFIKNKRKLTFNQVLFEYIDQNGAADSDVDKRAGIDRRHFSKIRSNPDYRPGKNTVISLALALQLDKNKADRLLRSAGYSLSDSDTFDLVIQFCFEKKIHQIHDVNMALDYFSLKPLAGVPHDTI
jgi:hypothetical protein